MIGTAETCTSSMQLKFTILILLQDEKFFYSLDHLQYLQNCKGSQSQRDKDQNLKFRHARTTMAIYDSTTVLPLTIIHLQSYTTNHHRLMKYQQSLLTSLAILNPSLKKYFHHFLPIMGHRRLELTIPHTAKNPVYNIAYLWTFHQKLVSWNLYSSSQFKLTAKISY